MNETNIKPKQLAICFLCDKPYTKLYKKKRYCRVHLHKKLGIVTKPKKKLSDEEKEQYIHYPRFMWEEKVRSIHKLTYDVVKQIETEKMNERKS
jgi:hypothetical protein